MHFLHSQQEMTVKYPKDLNPHLSIWTFQAVMLCTVYFFLCSQCTLSLPVFFALFLVIDCTPTCHTSGWEDQVIPSSSDKIFSFKLHWLGF